MVSGQIGDIAVLLTLGMAVLAGLAFLLTAVGKRNLYRLGVRAYYLQIAFITVAVAYLWYLFFRHDFTIEYVYSYSSSDLSFFYLLSAFWAGQEGTYLLWAFLSGLFGLIIIHGTKGYRTWGMFFYSLINVFLLIMLMVLSPFRPLGFSAPDGAGLNPLLQDPWMVIHPPLVFVAFALAGVPFVIVMAAMLRKDYAGWLKLSFPYVAMISLALALANVLGGYWAYKTLGWGGYWAWDPVENTSFIPWVVSLGLIHGMLVEKRSGALRRSNLLLTAFVFILVIYGTFLTRSGVLADFSVHSFVDLGVNAVLISFLVSFLLIVLLVFIFTKSPDRIGKPLNFNIFSRDFILFTGMVLPFVLGMVVLFWSSLPLLTKYLSENPSAAEISTYNTFAFPLAIIFSLFLMVGPFIKGPGHRMSHTTSRVLFSLVIALIVSGILYHLNVVALTMAVIIFIYLAVVLIYAWAGNLTGKILSSLSAGLAVVIISFLLGVRNIEYLFFIGAAVAAASTNIIILVQYIPKRIDLIGGHLAHFGYGLMLVGILASSAFSTHKTIVLPRGQADTAYRYDIVYHGTTGSISDENNEILLSLIRGDDITDARPQLFYNRRADGIMKRPYIKKSFLYDLYFSPQDIQEIPGSQGLVLQKGETRTVGDFAISFIDFEISSHSASQAMSVGAKLEVEYGGKKESITPQLSTDLSGEAGNMNAAAVDLPGGTGYRIKLDRVYADDGTVALTIPGLAESGPPDKLILDVSRKPGINLLWIGTIFVFIGMFVAIVRRARE